MLRLKRELEIQQQMCSMEDILSVLTNKHRRKGEERLTNFVNSIVPGVVKNAKMTFLRRPIFDKMS